MGITARGVWVSVHRHLETVGIDAESDPCTAVGIGDMSRDVFGNGLLLLLRSAESSPARPAVTRARVRRCRGAGPGSAW
ncbi:NAD-glutamate dehydrogenase domain-containing protein [Gordonia paraffinivorans]|uniref:NAD-glutamate dehydrogenase domain-containing protein n=1 Tax=Gordonia paraffinivorans TaxID=175628 RepID=UPI0024927698|nr:NAD-glutamate dehydrogenase domain-containing protein [Gordonia paraffinivorans]